MASLNDNTLLTANNLGDLTTSSNIADTFDATDRIAFYRFTLPQNSDLSVSFSGTSLQADLVADLNGNGVVDNNEVIRGRFGLTENFLEPLPLGTYLIRLQTFSTQANPYNLRLAATPRPGNVLPDPGNTLSQAFDLGVLSGTRVVRDYVGDLDEIDFYRFTVTQPSNLGIVIGGETRTTPVEIVADRNGNGIVDSNEVIASRFSTRNDLSAALPPGAYFIQVGQTLGTVTTQYELTLNQVPDFRGDDRLVGTPRRDVIRGFEGNDTISGLGGNDRLFGDADNDTLFGGTGDDLLFGGTGNDRLLGEAGNDVLDGGAGNDVITTGPGFDRIVLRRGGGFDRVTDFQNGRDKVDLVGMRFGQLTFQQQRNDVLIKLGRSNVMLLERTNINAIDRSDFV